MGLEEYWIGGKTADFNILLFALKNWFCDTGGNLGLSLSFWLILVECVVAAAIEFRILSELFVSNVDCDIPSFDELNDDNILLVEGNTSCVRVEAVDGVLSLFWIDNEAAPHWGYDTVEPDDYEDEDEDSGLLVGIVHGFSV